MPLRLATGGYCVVALAARAVKADGSLAQVPVPRCDASTAESISVSWTSNAGFGLYYVQLFRAGGAPGQPVALQTTKGSGVVLSGLAPGTNYAVGLRALPVEARSMSWGPAWLRGSGPVLCNTSAGRASPLGGGSSAGQPAGPASTRFMRVYRLSEYSFDVDFLENHNAASADALPLYLMSCDKQGDCNPWDARRQSPHWDACHGAMDTLCPGSRGAAFNCMMCAEGNRGQLEAVCGNWTAADSMDGIGSFAIHWWCGVGWPETATQQGPITEYCVEYLPLQEQTRMGDGFSDYLSCNSDEVDGTLGNDPRDPSCICIVWDDRLLSHQTNASWLAEDCGVGRMGWIHEKVCNCTGQVPKSPLPRADSPSLKHVGRTPVWLPYVGMEMAPWVPGGVQVPSGFNYHFPRGGACPEGEEVGTGGCVWRRLPRARMVYGHDLTRQGWDTAFVPDTVQNWTHTTRNIAAFKAAFQALDEFVQPPPCGPGRLQAFVL